jgi:capsular exopolysaccharide synthesis family protein
MSKIHQAMRRAEKEGGLGTGIIPSGLQERTQGTIPRESPSRPPIHNLVLPKNESIPSPLTDFSVSAERKITPDSRLVALSSRTYEGLRDRLRPAREEARAGGNDLKAILFTGVGSGEGKSLTVANLSISISKGLGERVLLVDANLRAPSLHQLLGMDQESGLSNVLQGTVAASQAILGTDVSNFYLMTAGNRVENPTQLLNTRKMSDFLALAKKHFDWVFLDSPSLIPEPDADLMSSMVDAVVLVTRSSQSCANPLRDGIRMLQGRNVLGVVLNDVGAHSDPFDYFSGEKFLEPTQNAYHSRR